MINRKLFIAFVIITAPFELLGMQVQDPRLERALGTTRNYLNLENQINWIKQQLRRDKWRKGDCRENIVKTLCVASVLTGIVLNYKLAGKICPARFSQAGTRLFKAAFACAAGWATGLLAAASTIIFSEVTGLANIPNALAHRLNPPDQLPKRGVHNLYGHEAARRNNVIQAQPPIIAENENLQEQVNRLGHNRDQVLQDNRIAMQQVQADQERTNAQLRGAQNECRQVFEQYINHLRYNGMPANRINMATLANGLLTYIHLLPTTYFGEIQLDRNSQQTLASVATIFRYASVNGILLQRDRVAAIRQAFGQIARAAERNYYYDLRLAAQQCENLCR